MKGKRSKGQLVASWQSQLQLEPLNVLLKDLKDQAEDIPFWKNQSVCSLRVDTNWTALSQSMTTSARIFILADVVSKIQCQIGLWFLYLQLRLYLLYCLVL